MIKLEPTPGTCIGYTGIVDKPIKDLSEINLGMSLYDIGREKIVTLVIPEESEIEHPSLTVVPGTKKKLLSLNSSIFFKVAVAEFKRRVKNGQKVLSWRPDKALRVGDRMAYCPYANYPSGAYANGGEYWKITGFSPLRDRITFSGYPTGLYALYLKFVPTDAEVIAELGSLPE